MLLPTGSKEQKPGSPQLNAIDAASAASAAISDLSQFCTRQPEACAVGSTVASVLAQRAQDGALMVYEFITEHRDSATDKIETLPARYDAPAGIPGGERVEATGSITAGPSTTLPTPRPMQSQDTLTADDRAAVWRDPSPNIQVAHSK
jgi:hypothetical protein